MRKKWLITVLLGLLIMGVGAWILSWPRTVPFSKCSEIYQKYAGSPGIDASFIKDFKINDTLNVDVTVLKATDSIGWETLRSDYDIHTPPPNFMQRISDGENLIFTKFILEKDSTLDSSSTPKAKALIATSHLCHTLTIFNITEKTHIRAIFEYTYPYPNNDQQTDNNPAPINKSKELSAMSYSRRVDRILRSCNLKEHLSPTSDMHKTCIKPVNSF